MFAILIILGFFALLCAASDGFIFDMVGDLVGAIFFCLTGAAVVIGILVLVLVIWLITVEIKGAKK